MSVSQNELGAKWYELFDWPLFILTISITLVGVLFIYSATFSSESEYLRTIYLRQVEWMFYGIIIMILCASVDYRFFERSSYLFYLLLLFLLASVLLHSRAIAGSQRWISFAGFNIQPSEFAKVILILTLARFFNDKRESRAIGFKGLFLPTIIALIPAGLIAKQPDMGTAVVIAFIFVSMAFVAGIRKKTIIIITTAGVVMVPLLWFSLKTYQKNRILAMLDPTTDPLGIGYHIIQSKIAIGSGGVFGKGLFAGTQSKLNFLPEKHTDFIFSVFSEEVGFAGATILLILYLFLLLRMVDTISKSADKGGSLIAVGGTAMLGFHIFYNVAMTVGITPIVGIPLPLFSYGGSSLVTNYAIIGMLLSVSMRRFRHG